MQISNAMCNYLRAIAKLQESQACVHNIDLALYLGFSKASVTKALQYLNKRNLIEIQNRNILLTTAGKEKANTSQQYFNTIYDHLLVHKFSRYDAHAYSMKLLNVMDEDFFEKFLLSLKDKKEVL